jgi:hypothetical protein
MMLTASGMRRTLAAPTTLRQTTLASLINAIA